MGDYTHLRMKATVKKEFIDIFGEIALDGEWSNSSDEIFKEFGRYPRNFMIPCGMSEYIVDSWIDNSGVAKDGFGRSYNYSTGYWTFLCSLKNQADTIEKFFEIVPYFIENIECAESLFEYDEYSKIYELKNGVITTSKGFKY